MFDEIRKHQELQKANILRGFGIESEDELELEIFKAQETDIEKAKHQDGDMHPNGKWVWVASAAGGKGDWRTIGGRAHKKAGGSSTTPSSVKTPLNRKLTDAINIDNGDVFSYTGISSKGIFKLLFPDLNDFTYEEINDAGYDLNQMSALVKKVKEVSKRVQNIMTTYQSVTDKLNPPESHSYGKLLYQHFDKITFDAVHKKTSDIEKKSKEVESKLKKAETLYNNTPKFGEPDYNRKYLEGKAYAVAKLRAEKLAYDTIVEARKVAKKELGQINLSDYKLKKSTSDISSKNNNTATPSSPYKYASVKSVEEAIKGGVCNVSDMTLEKFLELEPFEMSYQERQEFDWENGMNATKKLSDVRKLVEAADREILTKESGYSVNKLKSKQDWARSELKQGRLNRAMAIMYEWVCDAQERRKLFFKKYYSEAAEFFKNNYKHKHPRASDSKASSEWHNSPMSKLLYNAWNNSEDQYNEAFKLMIQYADKQTEEDEIKKKTIAQQNS